MKKVRKNKVIPLIIVLTLIVAVIFLPSCNNNTAHKQDNQNIAQNAETNAGVTEAAAAAETDKYEDELPEMDFKGEPFRMLAFPSYTNAHAFLVVEEENGDAINDAVYKANNNVQERFNIAFEQIECSGYGDALSMMKKTVDAGDNAYDFVILADRDAFSLASQGKYFHAFDELPFVDLDKGYWNQSMKSTLSIANKLYFTYGANMLSMYDFTCILLFNKKLAEDLALENMYQLVRDGKWTTNKMIELAKAATADLNGDGVMKNTDDRYGIASRGDYLYGSFWIAEGIHLIDKGDDDIPYFNVPGNAKLFNVFDKLNEISKGDYIWGPKNDTDPPMEMFSKGNALFFSSTIYTTWRLRGMEIDYGIIPYPTLEEKNPGEPYTGRAQGGFPIVVPYTSDAVRGSVIMEALACEYQKYVMPAYYNNTIQIKATRDEESIEMLDMIITNSIMDLGDSIWLSIARDKYTALFVNKKGDTAASQTEAIAQLADDTIQKAIDNINSIQ